jgi:tetratricopeptide (TPR) repeat protein
LPSSLSSSPATASYQSLQTQSSLLSSTTTTTTSSTSSSITPCGQVFVCTNKYCKEKGSDATMATFVFLTNPSTPVVGVNCLGRCNKGPNVRILTTEGAFIEVSAVRSVDTVVELLQTYLNMKVNITSAEVLRLNYEGNVFLRNGDVDNAIECYDKALELGDREQEGVILVMRGTALLQRAFLYRMRHKDISTFVQEILPSTEVIRAMFDALAPLSPVLRARTSIDLLNRMAAIYKNLDLSPKWADLKSRWPEREGSLGTSGEELIDRASFSWSLYEHALMRSVQDLLTATMVLPGFAQSWRRAGDALAELKLYASAIEYYSTAIRIDSSLTEQLAERIARMKVLDRLIENAAARGYPSEAILYLIEE